MSDFFKTAVYVDRYAKIVGSNTRITEQDLYDADLKSFWKLVSLSGSVIVVKEPIKTDEIKDEPKDSEVKDKANVEREWEKLEQKIVDTPSPKVQEQQMDIDIYLQEYDRLKNDVDSELIKLSNLYRIENLSSKKQQIVERIKKLKNYKSNMDPRDLAEYVVMKLGGDGDVVQKILKARAVDQKPEQPKEQHTLSTMNFEPYRPIFDTLERMSNSSLMLYLAKFEPEMFKKYSLKQISEEEAIQRAKYYYLKQKGVPDNIIQKYLQNK
ncbi:MAG: hypothetical protein QXQ15_00195 [Candidatus Anstonellales archaeon]